MDKVEREAIRQVLTGDRDAYRILMDRHIHAVHRIAFRITGNIEDAEECTQEAFLRAYNKLSSFRLDSTFSTWVTRIAMNTALNLVERRNRDHSRFGPRITEDTFAGTDTVQFADRQAGPERLLLDREAQTLREIALSELTPMERTAFTLRHMEELPIDEIAIALNVTGNSAKQAVFRAVGKLRKALGASSTTPAASGDRR